MRWSSSGVWLVGVLRVAVAFVLVPTTRVSRVALQSIDDAIDDFSDQEKRHQKLLLNNFLTQRSLQTLIFYQKTNRDRVTANWLERFENHEGIARFHGTHGLRISWEEYVGRMITSDIEHIVVSLKRRGNGIGGWSRSNPYLQERYFNYTVDIFPRNLAERVLDLRRALAVEWRKDLEDVAVLHSRLVNARRAIARNGTDQDARRLAMPVLEGYDAAIGAGDSTAFRGGNFDLLDRLSVQQAILRTLRQLDGHKTPQAAYTRSYLETFYSEHGSPFDGDAPYHVAQDFLVKIADQPPRVRSEDGATLLLDPMGIVERIMTEQAKLVALWRSLLLDVPDDNARLRRQALEATFL